MIRVPPYLRPGDTIAIVCPAGYMPLEKAQTCIETLQHWGYRVRIGKTLGGPSDNYFSGNDDHRLADLQQALDDPEVKAILCGRGGYGLSRIIDRIRFSRFEKEPKWIIGFSDITILHAHINTRFHISTLHASMAGAFNDGGADWPDVQSLRMALTGGIADYSCPPHPLNRTGRTIAPLTGGNLALVAHLTGSVSAVDTKGQILFLEDVGEYLYNIDRMMHQLKRSGQLGQLAGLILGGFTEIKDTLRPFGATVEEIICDCIKEFDYPVCFGFPVSHGKGNLALKTGVSYELTVAAGQTSLRELP